MERTPQIIVPESKRFSVDGRSYALQPVRRKLALDNATRYGAAVNRVRSSERNEPVYGETANISEGARIARAGNGILTVVLIDIDNDHPDPGTPDTVIGVIQPQFEKVWNDYQSEDFGYRERFSPSIDTGPELSRDNNLLAGTRIKIKLRMIDFALRTLMNSKKYLTDETHVLINPLNIRSDNRVITDILGVKLHSKYKNAVPFPRLKKSSFEQDRRTTFKLGEYFRETAEFEDLDDVA